MEAWKYHHFYDEANIIAWALREIRHFQSKKTADHFLLLKSAFARFVKEVLEKEAASRMKSALAPHIESEIRIQSDAVIILQQMSEQLLNDVFQMAYRGLV